MLEDVGVQYLMINPMPYLTLIFSVLVLSQAPNLVKLSSAPSMVMIFWRLFLAAIILGVVGAFKTQLGELKKLTKKDWIIISFTTIVLFAHFVFWFVGVRKTSVANSAIIFATNPIFTAIGGHFFFHERFTKKYAMAMIMGFIGITITFFDHLKFSPDAFLGDMMVLVGAILFSGYILLSKRVRNHLSNIPFTFILNLVTALFALAAILLTTPGDSLYDYDLKSWLSFSLMAIFSSVLGHSLFTHCLNFFNVNLMSCTMLLSPILASLVSYYFYHETLSLKTILGFIIAASGVFSMYFPYNRYLKRR